MRRVISATAVLAALSLALIAPAPSYASPGDEDLEVPEPPELEPAELEPPEIELPDPEPAELEPPEIEAPEAEAPELEGPELETPEPQSPESEVGGPETETEAADDEASGSDLEDDESGSNEDEDESEDGGDDFVEDDSDGQAAIAHLTEPLLVEQNADGREYVANEVLVAAARADVARAQTLGYQLISTVDLDTGDREVARLLVPASRTVEHAIAELQALLPSAVITINNAYRSSQVNARRTQRAPPRSNAPAGGGLVGVVDTGADPSAALSPLAATRGFGSAGYAPREHGSAVVSILTRSGAHAQVADVFGPSRSGEPYAAASAIIAALRWMVETGVPVINISIEGPRNPILESAIRDAAQQGHVIVAAAGNGGPLAPPAYPGAYDGVLAVTAVDADGHAYLGANRGDYVDFAALGVQVPVETDGVRTSVTGTSFAAPIVAARLAQQLREPSPTEAARAIEALQRAAIDRGRPGRDRVYGWGEVRGE